MPRKRCEFPVGARAGWLWPASRCPRWADFYADVNDDETVDADDIGPFILMLLAD